MYFEIFLLLLILWLLAFILAYYSAGIFAGSHLNKNQKKILRRYCRKWFLNGVLFRFKTKAQMEQEVILCAEEIENNK